MGRFLNVLMKNKRCDTMKRFSGLKKAPIQAELIQAGSASQDTCLAAFWGCLSDEAELQTAKVITRGHSSNRMARGKSHNCHTFQVIELSMN